VQYPSATTTTVGVPTESIFGRVYVNGVTGLGVEDPDMHAEIGYGPTDKDPRLWPDLFTWSSPTYNSGHTGDDNDEYGTPLTVNAADAYHYVYRFGYETGVEWTYCDFDPGTTDGFDPNDLGDLTVNASE
jgi:hypothetical protein